MPRADYVDDGEPHPCAGGLEAWEFARSRPAWRVLADGIAFFYLGGGVASSGSEHSAERYARNQIEK